ncbi:hypothetical protein QQG55_4280 [Brugia pahangi]
MILKNVTNCTIVKFSRHHLNIFYEKRWLCVYMEQCNDRVEAVQMESIRRESCVGVRCCLFGRLLAIRCES